MYLNKDLQKTSSNTLTGRLGRGMPTLVRADTITFTAPGTIADSGNGLGVFKRNTRLRVRGSSALNNREFIVDTVAAGSLTVRSPYTVIEDGSAGEAIVLTQV